VDFVLAFALVHEMPDSSRFFSEAVATLKRGGRLLLSEPRGHVSQEEWAGTLKAAEDAGLSVEGRPVIWRSWSALLRKV